MPRYNRFKKNIDFATQEEALRAAGQYDSNFRKLEKKYDVAIYARGNKVTIQGKREDVEKSISSLLVLPPCKEEQSKIRETSIDNTKPGARALNKTQEKYIASMRSNTVVIAIGPAGTGKTFLACAHALERLRQGEAERIIMTRPVVEAGEKLGYLPGNLQDKVDPYIRPLYDAFYTIIGSSRLQRYVETGVIEIVPLAYMRGRTFDDAVIILDEAQNTSSLQMKMFLTRLGFNSTAVITGDITQVDLEKTRQSGLIESQKILKGLEDIEFVYFTKNDVVRHRLVKKIIDAYSKFSEVN